MWDRGEWERKSEWERGKVSVEESECGRERVSVGERE